MNKWLYRAVGTVGVASGFLLLGGGAAHADDANAARPAIDPQQLRGLFDDLLTPLGGTPAGLLADTPAAQPVRPGDAPAITRGAPGAAGAPGAVSTAGNDLFLSGLLPDVGDQLALDRLAPTQNLGMLPATPRTPAAGVRPVADTSESAATELLPVPSLSSLPLSGLPLSNLPLSNLPLSNLPLVGQMLNSQTIAPTPGGSPLRAAQAPAPIGARTLPATTGVPATSDLPAALPVAGVDPVGPAGLVDTLPVLGGAGDGATVDGDQLGQDQALGLVPSGVRPAVKTGAVGTQVPGMGKVGLDDRGAAPVTGNRAAAPAAQDRVAAPGLPALIGDALTAQRPDLFGPAPAATAPAPVGRHADRPIGRHAERPVAGEDADFS